MSQPQRRKMVKGEKVVKILVEKKKKMTWVEWMTIWAVKMTLEVEKMKVVEKEETHLANDEVMCYA